MASVSAAIAGEPVSGVARISVASSITPETWPKQADLVGEFGLGIGQLLDPVDHLVHAVAQAVLGLGELAGLLAVLFGRHSGRVPARPRASPRGG